MNIMLIILGLIFLIISIAALYYFVRSLIVMFNDSPAMGILGFLFAPIVHIVFYFSNKDKLSVQEASFFKRYFITIVIMIILGIVFTAIGINSANEMNSMVVY